MSLLMCRLKSQIPQITQTLEILQHMQKKKVCIFFVDCFFFYINKNILYPIFHMWLLILTNVIMSLC